MNILYDEIIQRALLENIGTSDITTMSVVDKELECKGNFIAKEDGVICGMNVVKRLYELLDNKIKIDVFYDDKSFVKKGDIIASISGKAAPALIGERIALNFLQHLSAIATKTQKCVKAIEGTGAKITDTRKTTPGLLVLEKYAVKTGGGMNHRYNLSDGILIKDNHIKAAGGVKKAISKARQNAPHTLKIEVEVENMDMLEEALEGKADIIMLDNMNLDEMKKAVDIVGGRALVEASGNMGEKDLKKVAETGVDFISVGALTHSVKAMDISLRFL